MLTTLKILAVTGLCLIAFLLSSVAQAEDPPAAGAGGNAGTSGEGDQSSESPESHQGDPQRAQAAQAAEAKAKADSLQKAIDGLNPNSSANEIADLKKQIEGLGNAADRERLTAALNNQQALNQAIARGGSSSPTPSGEVVPTAPTISTNTPQASAAPLVVPYQAQPLIAFSSTPAGAPPTLGGSGPTAGSASSPTNTAGAGNGSAGNGGRTGGGGFSVPNALSKAGGAQAATTNNPTELAAGPQAPTTTNKAATAALGLNDSTILQSSDRAGTALSALSDTFFDLVTKAGSASNSIATGLSSAIAATPLFAKAAPSARISDGTSNYAAEPSARSPTESRESALPSLESGSQPLRLASVAPPQSAGGTSLSQDVPGGTSSGVTSWRSSPSLPREDFDGVRAAVNLYQTKPAAEETTSITVAASPLPEPPRVTVSLESPYLPTPQTSLRDSVPLEISGNNRSTARSIASVTIHETPRSPTPEDTLADSLRDGNAGSARRDDRGPVGVSGASLPVPTIELNATPIAPYRAPTKQINSESPPVLLARAAELPAKQIPPPSPDLSPPVPESPVLFPGDRTARAAARLKRAQRSASLTN